MLLAGLHQAQHQALMDMKLEQEDRFRLLVQTQDEDRRAIRSLLGREETPVAAPSIAHVPLMKMGPHDDPEAFVDLFEKTAEACGWARSQWPVRLIPLLMGEAQVAAQQLPVANLLAYEDLKRAILRPKPRAAPSTLPLRGTRGLRPTVRDGSTAPGRMPQVALGRAPRRRGSDRPGGAGAFHCPTTPADGWVRPSSWLRTIWRRSPGSPSPGLISLSLSLFPLPSHLLLSLAQSQLPGRGCRWPLEPHHGVGMDRATVTAGEGGGGRDYHLSTVLSPAIPCPPFCRGGGGKAWAGLLEMRGLLVRVPDSPGAAPDQAGQYKIPVSIKGGTYQALVDSGCNQTSIHQSLIQQRALDTGRKVKVRCVHGDVANYPLVPVSIQFQGKIHRMQVAVNSHLKHPLILGTDWPAFTQLLSEGGGAIKQP